MAAAGGVEKFQDIIEYRFKDTKTLKIAVLHPGVKKVNAVFERLEFLGDRVLGLSLSSLLYEKFPNDRESDLATRISILAGTDFLIDLAKRKRIIDCFAIPKDFFVSSNKNSSAIADMFEAVLGAL
jgi:ribonuclease-3